MLNQETTITRRDKRRRLLAILPKFNGGSAPTPFAAPGDGGRIEYIDALRGLTMILVVFSHVALLTFKKACPANDFFIIFRMPLFFFISGFMTYSANYSRELMVHRSKNRLLMQLLPTVVMLALYVFVFHIKVHRALYDTGKVGYWFTLVVVQCFFLYMALNLIFKLTKASRRWQTVTLLGIMIASYVGWRVMGATGSDKLPIFKLLSLPSFLLYTPYFFFGVLARMHWQGFCKVIAHGWFMGAMIVAFIAMYYFDVWGNAIILQRLVGVVIVFRIFQYYGETFSGATAIGRMLSHIGQYTLEIYLLHYFFIRSIRKLPQAMDWSPVTNSWLLQLAAYLAIALAITGICMLIAKAMRISPPAYRLCFGKLK